MKSEYRRYKGKRIPWCKVLLCLALAGVLLWGTAFGLILSGARDDVEGEPRIMVILGCQVMSWGPSILLQDRLNTALDYLKDHPDMTVVVSGGQGPDEPTTEAEAMYDYLVEKGVAPGRILLEDESHNTVQNMRYTLALLEREGYDPGGGVLVVSNGFHLARARVLWDRVTGEGETLSTLAAPSTHGPSRLKMYIREPFALIKSFLLDR